MIWHKEQILHLQQLKNQGLTAAKIAETMGVSKQDIYNVTHLQKNKQVPRGFKEGDMVMIQIARGMTPMGWYLTAKQGPIWFIGITPIFRSGSSIKFLIRQQGLTGSAK